MVSLPELPIQKNDSPLVKAGFRCIAPDHIGFGKSDKVLQPDWYTAASHINRLAVFIEKLELSDITLFVQDWGGPIGLVNAVRIRSVLVIL